MAVHSRARRILSRSLADRPVLCSLFGAQAMYGAKANGTGAVSRHEDLAETGRLG